MKRTFKQTVDEIVGRATGQTPIEPLTRTVPPPKKEERTPMVVNRVSKITSTMRDLHEESCDLEKNISELENGLTSACVPCPPEEEIEPPLPCDIPLADNIIAIIVCLKRANRRLVSLNKRIEL